MTSIQQREALQSQIWKIGPSQINGQLIAPAFGKTDVRIQRALASC